MYINSNDLNIQKWIEVAPVYAPPPTKFLIYFYFAGFFNPFHGIRAVDKVYSLISAFYTFVV